ncbi:MAG: glycosyltransferase family 9 protein [Planctomycetes bacterium]|nr:glycosyltransferase family 9 protein [Planctomycetota bacterium]
MKLLIHFPFWLGDFIMALPLAATLRNEDPQARIIAVIEPVFRPLIEASQLGFEVWDFGKKKRFALFDRLRRDKPDAVVLLTNSFGSIWPYWLAGVKNRRGFGGAFTRFLLDSPPAGDPAPAQGMKNLLLAKGAPEVRPNTLMEPLISGNLPSTLLLFTGAKYGPAKQWGLDRFEAVAALAVAAGWRVELHGTAADREDALSILGRMGEPEGLSEHCGRVDLGGLLRHLSQVPNPVCLANDSGAMHLASACGIPTVGLFTSTDPLKTPPALGPCTLLSAEVECRPCFARRCPLGHQRCREVLSVERVWNSLLESTRNRSCS